MIVLFMTPHSWTSSKYGSFIPEVAVVEGVGVVEAAEGPGWCGGLLGTPECRR